MFPEVCHPQGLYKLSPLRDSDFGLIVTFWFCSWSSGNEGQIGDWG